MIVRSWKVRAAAAGLGVALALAGLGCAARSAAPYESGASRYRFKFSLTRAPGETGACTASASVTDTAARRGIAIPIFTAPWGATTSAAAVDSVYGARLQLTVAMEAAGGSGEFSATLRRGESLIASRKASIPVAVVVPVIRGTTR